MEKELEVVEVEEEEGEGKKRPFGPPPKRPENAIKDGIISINRAARNIQNQIETAERAGIAPDPQLNVAQLALDVWSLGLKWMKAETEAFIASTDKSAQFFTKSDVFKSVSCAKDVMTLFSTYVKREKAEEREEEQDVFLQRIWTNLDIKSRVKKQRKSTLTPVGFVPSENPTTEN